MDLEQLKSIYSKKLKISDIDKNALSCGIEKYPYYEDLHVFKAVSQEKETDKESNEFSKCTLYVRDHDTFRRRINTKYW